MATRRAARGAPSVGPESAPAADPRGELDPRAELSEFLRTRRARLKPADVGLADHSRRRRVPGLRREELAQLAGVSAAYHTRFEQGNARNVSREVLDALSRVLRLSDAEHAHLLRLARPKRHQPPPEPPRQQVRPAVQELLTAMEVVPAYPLVGELTPRYETLTLPGDPEQSLTSYHAEPGSPSEEALRLLASWGADASQQRTTDHGPRSLGPHSEAGDVTCEGWSSS